MLWLGLSERVRSGTSGNCRACVATCCQPISLENHWIGRSFPSTGPRAGVSMIRYLPQLHANAYARVG